MSEFEEVIVAGRCSCLSLLVSEFGTGIAL